MIEDEKFLSRAIEIAAKGIKTGCGPFGAVVANDGQIISESNNKVVLSKDPTAHAEILAIREAARILDNHNLEGCTLYSSCEPCPMCLGAIYWSGIKRVIYASSRLDAAEAGFDDNLIYTEISLDPSARQIEFQFIDNPDAKSVFTKWEETENKISY